MNKNKDTDKSLVDEQSLSSEKEDIINVESTDKKIKADKFRTFLKKNGFYLGLATLVLIMAVVLIFDANRKLKGDIPFDNTVYVIGDNSISLVKHDEEPIVLTSTLFKDYKDQQLGLEAHNGILMSNDEEKIMYVDELHLINNDEFSQSRLIGTLRLFDGTSNIKISDEASFYYVVNDDFNTVIYKKYRVSDDNKTLINDLYKFDLITKESVLIKEDVDTDIFSLSNDGKVCVFLDDYAKSYVENGEPTYSLYKYEDGKTVLVSDNVYNMEASVSTGNADLNYPLINKDGKKIIYAIVNYVVMTQDEEQTNETEVNNDKIKVYPTFDMYMYDDGNNELVAKSCAQLLVSYDFSQMIYIDGIVDHIDKYDEMGFGGTYYHYNLLTNEKTIVSDYVFGFVPRNVIGYVDNEYIDANFYFKQYNIDNNTAHLYTYRDGKHILIDKEVSVGSDEELKLDFVTFSDDYKTVFVFKSYISKTSSLLYRYSIRSTGNVIEYMCEEKYIINKIKLTTDEDYLVYNAEGRLVILSSDNTKKTIEREGVNSFDITEGGRYIYYYKETAIGAGAVYYYDLQEGKESVKLVNNVNEVWNYQDNMVMFRINTDYNTMTGDLYLTDFDQFEYLSPNVYAQIRTKITER